MIKDLTYAEREDLVARIRTHLGQVTRDNAGVADKLLFELLCHHTATVGALESLRIGCRFAGRALGDYAAFRRAGQFERAEHVALLALRTAGRLYPENGAVSRMVLEGHAL